MIGHQANETASEAIAAATIYRRAMVVVFAVAVVWLVLAGRLMQLQWLQKEQFAGAASKQRLLIEDVPARPGDIVDRQGRLLATTVSTSSLFAVPKLIAEPWGFSQAVAAALDIDADRLFERLGQADDRQFIWVKRRLSEEEAEKIRQLDLPKGTWGFREEYRRHYPQGSLAAHVLGLRDIDGVGKGGVEESLSQVLCGTAGRRLFQRDSRGRVFSQESENTTPPIDGLTVRLTIDSVLQLYTERELDRVMEQWKPGSTCAAVLDPKTGEVLAMASRPTFNPNSPQDAITTAWKNRTIADIYEPGSTIKPLFVAYGLEHGLLQRDESFNCENGAYRMGRRILHDHKRYGMLSLTDVLVKSSNIGMAKIGERISNRGLYEAATLFGFGTKTGIELPGELTGILRPFDKWTSYSTGSIPMGHELACTPLQLLVAQAALCNGGVLQQPKIVLRASAAAVNEEGVTEQTPSTGVDLPLAMAATQAVSSEAANWVRTGPMYEVVTRGTGKKARIPGYRVFGKTGTSQTLSPTGGYRSGAYVSSFICGAPLDDPRVIVIVVVDQATVGSEAFGGKVAAPAAASILRQALVHLRIPAESEGLLSTPLSDTPDDMEEEDESPADAPVDPDWPTITELPALEDDRDRR